MVWEGQGALERRLELDRLSQGEVPTVHHLWDHSQTPSAPNLAPKFRR